MANRVLFVDDEPSFLDGLRRVLRTQAGVWEMAFAQSVDEALEYVRGGQVDVIITDFRMPGKSGLDLVESLKEIRGGADIPVVLLTGSDESDLKRRALEVGATDLLGKPVDREDLLARISSVLRLKSYQDELRTLNATLERKVEERTAQLERSRLDVLWRLAKAGEYRDEGTGNHVIRVSHYSRVLAEQLGATRDFARTIFLTSPLHDIGKIGIPDAILLKPDRLEPEERVVMQKHCEIGARILQGDMGDDDRFRGWSDITAGVGAALDDNQLLSSAASVALGHHEKWDGSGYPRRLAGEDIPLEARVVAVADVYDALRSERPYKPAYSHEQVMEIMAPLVGAHFCPTVFRAFEQANEQLSSIREQFADQDSAEERKRAA